MQLAILENKIVYEVYYSEKVNPLLCDKSEDIYDDLLCFDNIDNYEYAKGFLDCLITLNEKVKYACIVKVYADMCINGDPYSGRDEEREVVYQVSVEHESSLLS